MKTVYLLFPCERQVCPHIANRKNPGPTTGSSILDDPGQGFNGPFHIFIFFYLFFNPFKSVYHGGVILTPKPGTYLRIAGIREVAAEIHGDLPGNGDLLVLSLGLHVRDLDRKESSHLLLYRLYIDGLLIAMDHILEHLFGKVQGDVFVL